MGEHLVNVSRDRGRLGQELAQVAQLGHRIHIADAELVQEIKGLASHPLQEPALHLLDYSHILGFPVDIHPNQVAQVFALFGHLDILPVGPTDELPVVGLGGLVEEVVVVAPAP